MPKRDNKKRSANLKQKQQIRKISEDTIFATNLLTLFVTCGGEALLETGMSKDQVTEWAKITIDKSRAMLQPGGEDATQTK